jgi:chitinase
MRTRRVAQPQKAGPTPDSDTVVHMPLRIRPLVLFGALALVAVGGVAAFWASRDDGPPPPGAALPAKLVGVYLPTWGSVAVHDLPDAYNLIFAAFAVGDGTGGGRVTYSPDASQDAASLRADVAAAHTASRTVLISVGGANNNNLHVTTPQQVDELVASVSALVDEYGFDGMDWDIEDTSRWNAESALAASRALIRRYGSRFVIATAPSPGVVEWKDWARQMGPDLDLFGMQFYEFPATDAERIEVIDTRIREMVTDYGLDPSQLIIGGMNAESGCTTCDSPPEVYRDAFDQLEAAYPTLRGAYVWSATIDQDAGWPFAEVVGRRVRPTPG